VDYLELSLAVQPEAVDAAADLLRAYAPAGVSIEPIAEPIDEDGGARIDPESAVRLRAWLPPGPESRAAVATLRKQLRALEGIRRPLHARTVHDNAWVDAWKRYFRTMRVGRRIVIKPSWREYRAREGDIVLEVDPGMAFGTGQHATTQLCLEAIEELVAPGATMLDVGCGSGILSIAAARLGAERVDAIDIDAQAVRATQENSLRNGVSATLRVARGSLDAQWPFAEPPEGSYGVVAANLSSRLVQSMAAGLLGALRPDGVLIASGIIEEQEAVCRSAIEEAGGVIAGVQRREGWVALLARPGPGEG
jgi:ribosomal protein L11 methyltransferase